MNVEFCSISSHAMQMSAKHDKQAKARVLLKTRIKSVNKICSLAFSKAYKARSYAGADQTIVTLAMPQRARTWLRFRRLVASPQRSQSAASPTNDDDDDKTLKRALVDGDLRHSAAMSPQQTQAIIFLLVFPPTTMSETMSKNEPHFETRKFLPCYFFWLFQRVRVFLLLVILTAAAAQLR